MQTILSAIANLQANPLPSSRAVAEDASTAHQLKPALSNCRQALQGAGSRSALSWRGESGYDQSWTRFTQPIGLAGSSARRR